VFRCGGFLNSMQRSRVLDLWCPTGWDEVISPLDRIRSECMADQDPVLHGGRSVEQQQQRQWQQQWQQHALHSQQEEAKNTWKRRRHRPVPWIAKVDRDDGMPTLTNSRVGTRLSQHILACHWFI
jgi:hypothetical protein